jgi:hypothetical protein
MEEGKTITNLINEHKTYSALQWQNLQRCNYKLDAEYECNDVWQNEGNPCAVSHNVRNATGISEF